MNATRSRLLTSSLIILLWLGIEDTSSAQSAFPIGKMVGCADGGQGPSHPRGIIRSGPWLFQFKDKKYTDKVRGLQVLTSYPVLIHKSIHDSLFTSLITGEVAKAISGTTQLIVRSGTGKNSNSIFRLCSEITYNDASLIVVDFLCYAYRDEAAHDDTYGFTINWNSNNQRKLKLGDLVKTNDALVSIISQHLQEDTERMALKEPEVKSLLRKALQNNSINWRISPEGLGIYFNPYELGCRMCEAETVLEWPEIKLLLVNSHIIPAKWVKD